MSATFPTPITSHRAGPHALLPGPSAFRRSLPFYFGNCFPAATARRIFCALGALPCLLLGGCAVHYYDAQTGTDHLWGFGHVRMKGYPESPGRPLVTGTQMLGLNLRMGRGDYGLGVGYDSSSRVVMPENGALSLQWPTNYSPLPWEMRSLFTAEISSNFPPVTMPASGPSVPNPKP